MVQIEDRVLLMERRLNRYRLFCVTAVLLAAACASIGLAAPSVNPVVRARELQVVDDGGSTVLRLFADERGGVLLLNKTDGKTAIEIRQGEWAGTVQTFTIDNKLAIALSAVQEERSGHPKTYSGTIYIADPEKGSIAQRLSPYDCEFSGTQTFDSVRCQRLGVFTRSFEKSHLSYTDKEACVIGVGKNGASITLRDTKGNNRAILGSVALKDTQTDLVVSKPESSLMLFNEQGAVVFEVPR